MLDSKNICYSGGAIGADTEFGDMALKAGHELIDFSFAGHKTTSKNAIILSEDELRKADPFLKEANKILNRTFPTSSKHTNNLLRRNYYQIMNTERIYAVAGFCQRGQVYGGTAWAVTMGVLVDTDTYVFDQAKDKWYVCNGVGMGWSQWETTEEAGLVVPKASGKYTGIGSRDLKANGLSAIMSLYD